MRKIINFILILSLAFIFVGCGKCVGCKPIELMGAGDRIHDSFTFANVGVKIKNINDNKNDYLIYGDVEKLTDENVKSEFNISKDVNYVVAIKLSAIDCDVKKDEVIIKTNGNRTYDAEHLNGTNYTFVILEVVPNNKTTISVIWNKNCKEKTYNIYFDSNINLK